MQNDYYEELGISDNELLEKYPFTQAKNDWTGTPLDFTWYGLIPKGWRKGFGKELLEEMETEYNGFSDELKSMWIVLQVKEKYSELRIYTGPATQNMYDIIDKYTIQSRRTCMSCGAPCKQRGTGWVYTLCDECFDAMNNRARKKQEVR